MRRFHRVFLPGFALLAALLMAACADGTPSPGATPQNAAFGEPFRVQLNQSIFVGPDSLRVAFQEVLEDSRCPSDVTCIWAGRAVVSVALYDEDLPLGAASLTVGVEGEMAEAIGEHSVEVVTLDPYPVSTRPIAPADYLLTLIVSSS